MKKNKEIKGHTIGFSLASKLNIQLWIRQIGIFLTLNLIFLITSGVLLFFLAEQTAITVIQEDILETRELNGIKVTVETPREEGFKIPTFLRSYFPQETNEALRKLEIPWREDLGLSELLDRVNYRLELKEIALNLQFTSSLWLLKTLFMILLISQVALAFKTIMTRTSLVQEALRPIEELAKQAKSLSQDKGPLSVQEMQVIAGTLDEITAARLDTRIDLADTQDELKNLAAAINGLLSRIDESYRLQTRFVSDASHELRTPIAAIQGYVNLLDRWGKNDPQALQESIDALKEEAANMKDLVEQLLFLARGDNQSMHLELEALDLAPIAASIYKETKMISGAHNFSLEAEEAWVFADQGLVKQAGRILVDNAIKYTPLGERVQLKVKQKGDLVYFTVQDSGIGIPPEDIPHIFERFYRADESRARATGGTGLGLSIAKWIAERHGGYLEVLSREDLGSKISLVLPLKDHRPH